MHSRSPFQIGYERFMAILRESKAKMGENCRDRQSRTIGSPYFGVVEDGWELSGKRLLCSGLFP